MTIDGNSIAVVIGAVVAGVGSMATVGMQVLSFLDQRKVKLAQAKLLTMSIERDRQIATVKDLVNGKSEQLTAFVAQEAYEKGREHERLAPGTPSPTIAVVARPVASTAIVTAPADAPESDNR